MSNENLPTSKSKPAALKVSNHESQSPKSLAVQKPFRPTAAMRLWVRTSVTLDTAKISRIAEECGVDRNNWYNWLKKPGFLQWYDAEREEAMVLLRSQLDSIGLKQAAKDFRYFKLMQKIAGRDVSDDPAQPQLPGSPVQVNFNANKFIKER